MNEKMLNSLGGDKFMSVVNAVNKELTQSAIIELNGAVDLEGVTPPTSPVSSSSSAGWSRPGESGG